MGIITDGREGVGVVEMGFWSHMFIYIDRSDI